MTELDPRTVKTARFVRKPFYVDAIQVTSENIEAVAEWCGADVRTSAKGDPDIQTQQDPTTLSERVPEKYIKVRVNRPMNDRQTMAFVTDWVLYAGTGYKVYTNKAFEKSFELIDGELHHTGPGVANRDAVSGEFVTAEYAATHPDTTVSETTREV